MSESADPLAAFLAKRLRQEEIRRQSKEAEEKAAREWQKQLELEQQLEELERERRIRVLREKEKRRQEREQRLVQQFRQEMKEAEAQNRANQAGRYLIHYTSYHQLEKEADEWLDRFRNQGLQVENPWKWKEIYVRIGMQNWPEPYKSKCQFTDMERVIFLSDPMQAHLTMVWMPKIRTSLRESIEQTTVERSFSNYYGE